MYKPFNELKDIPDYFRIENNVEMGSPSWVKHPVLPIFVHSDGIPASVEIGNVISGSISVRMEIAYKADEILEMMHRYIESGDHDGIDNLEIVLIEDTYRLVTEIEDQEPDFFETENLDEIIAKISL
ncbi:hypothetical protein F0M16_21805 [Vibrio cholerae]|uniref:Uncharacterized protein n=1 Tax=Vibrio cholerae TaxID=666 RepID=A0A5Q6PD68_VIBCL|nr:hypothetical protein [Vibrio cholerae]KAA1252640.1 hypothetical protein F0M16_21805 [Vibrio cholerae]